MLEEILDIAEQKLFELEEEREPVLQQEYSPDPFQQTPFRPLSHFGPYYAAIDLHSTNFVIAVVNARGRHIKYARLFRNFYDVETSRVAIARGKFVVSLHRTILDKRICSGLEFG